MIKTIIFDNGGVIVKDNWLTFVTNTQNEYGIKEGSVTWKIVEMEKRATRGEITLNELLKYIDGLLQDENKMQLLYHPSKVDQQMLSFIKEIREKYEVALLTNEISSFDTDNKKWKLDEVFGQNIFCSSKIGYAKPDKRIYEYVLQSLQRKPNEVVFVDDRKQNNESAKTLGINTIQYKNISQLKSELKQFGVVCD